MVYLTNSFLVCVKINLKVNFSYCICLIYFMKATENVLKYYSLGLHKKKEAVETGVLNLIFAKLLLK